MSDWASDAGHWYKRDGTPMYEIVGKNGKIRNTTLRDARQLNLVPSVTTIIKEAAAPGLERWKQQQLLMAALTLTRVEGWTEAEYLLKIQEDGRAEGRAAADKGQLIHGAIERVYRDGMIPPSDPHFSWASRAVDVLLANCGSARWSAERSFAHPMGYGGRVDLHSDDWVVDIKTKDGVEDVKIWDEHPMQLGAYRRGLGRPNARCGILFVDRLSPACKFLEVGEEDLVRGTGMFDCLHTYWMIKTGYKAAWQMELV
jgi:hypothetical protein